LPKLIRAVTAGKLGAILATAAVVLVTACSPRSSSVAAPPHSTWGAKTSAADGGGMNALIAAARAEGQLNVIALPADWANYGAIIDGFKSKYGIKVTVTKPNGNSFDEITAVKKLGKSPIAPDVLDLNLKSAQGNTDLFTPYQVVTWGDIPTEQKNSIGLWYEDYGGFMAIGYDSAKVPAITTLEDLLKPEYKGKVALKGDPSTDPASLAAVLMASVAEGGSLDDISNGVTFFHLLRTKGSFTKTQATAATVKAGTTPVVFDWEFMARAHLGDVPTWQVMVPTEALIGGYFAQAINKDAPHPAAARLWEEYLYSDEGQNLWLRAGDRPVRMQAMLDAGQIDATAAAALPPVVGKPMFITPDQQTTALAYLSTHWAKAIA
jgi:putative spermidine/putrescine transport system substrate-binding protein